MQCYVYKGSRKADHFLYLNQTVEKFMTAVRLPPALLEMLGELIFVVEFQLDESRKLINADANQVIADIKSRGYYLQMPKDDMFSTEERYYS